MITQSLMSRALTAALFLTCLSQTAFADTPNTVLPTIKDESVQERAEEFARYPRSKQKDIDAIDILQTDLVQKAQEHEYSNSPAKAVEALDAAIRVSTDPSLRLKRGILLGRMGKWQAATEDLKIGSGSQVNEVAEFCLANGHPEIARLFESQLRKMYDKSAALRTISKICFNTGRAEEGRKICELAVYLDWVRGDDMAESLKYYEAVYCRCNPRNQQKNNSGEEVFWRTITDLIGKEIITSSADLKRLLTEPISEYGWESRGGAKSVFCYLADDMNSSIRFASFLGGDDAKPHGAALTPNLLTCCLTPDDVDKFLKKHGYIGERTETTKPNPYAPQEFSIVAKTNWGKLTFWFNHTGWQSLKRAEVYFNKTGPALLPPLVIPSKSPRTWQEELADSKTLMQQKKYLQSRSKLLNAFALWDGRSDLGGLPFTADKRTEYDALKQQFIQFYKQWGRPEVVRFIEATSHWKLAGEVYALLDGKTDDLPKFHDYKNEKWKLKISGSRGVDTIILRIPSCVPRKVIKGSPLFSELLQKSEDGSVYEQRTISPIPAKFLDDDDFAAAPVLAPATTPPPAPEAEPTPNLSK